MGQAANMQIADNAANDHLRSVRIWLYIVAALVLLMVAIGGITRLTDSGLSITTWKPITGAIPPLSVADWQAEFEAYQLIPEFTAQNSWMDIEAFKFIFWWEWSHRFLGRFIGLAFFVPFVVFLVQKRLNKKLAPALALLFVLGGFQGFLGWWMVSSGLSQRVDVSQYRLAAHLGAASLLFIALIWVARRTIARTGGGQVSANWRLAVAGLGVLVFVQLLAGAFVAGLDAGMAYNTWPLMDGAIVPNGLFVIDPMWRNFFENALTVQFNHRLIAYLIALYAVIAFVRAQKMPEDNIIRQWMPLIAALVGLQVVLGITTLLAQIPISLAIGHQALAFMLLGTITACLADVR